MKKMPPIEKIHEALSAIADGRVTMGEDRATVRSSGSGKEYTVTWRDNVYTSSDNATYWQLYHGYPIIAVLLLKGRLPLDKDIVAGFAGVDWTALNDKHKRKYAAAAAEVMAGLEETGADVGYIGTCINKIYEALDSLDIVVKRGSVRPPKGE